MAQTILFQFLQGYTLDVDVIPFPAAVPLQSNLPATEVTPISPTVAEYSVTTTGLPIGMYDIVAKTATVVMLTGRVNIRLVNGTFRVGDVLPDPAFVAAGIDRGDGVIGTLQPCPSTVTPVLTPVLSQVYIANDRIELLSITGGRTNSLGRVLRTLDNDLVEVQLDRDARVIQVGKFRLLPVFRTV